MFEERIDFHVTTQEAKFLFHHEISKAHGKDMRALSSISGTSAMREGNPTNVAWPTNFDERSVLCA